MKLIRNARLIHGLLAMALSAPAMAGMQEIHTTLTDIGQRVYWTYASEQVAGQRPVVYASLDGGETWDASVPLPTNEIAPPAIVGLAHSLDYLYVATAGEGVFRTDDGRNWEKWNDADVGFKYVSQSVQGSIVVITDDGATFVSSGGGFHNTFTQAYEVPLTATAVSLDGSTRIGTADGRVYTFMDGLFEITDGEGSRPGPLPGAIREIVRASDEDFYVVEFGDGSQAIYSKENWAFPGAFKRLYLDGAPIAVDAVHSSGAGIAAVTATDPQRLVCTSDNGETWSDIPLPVDNGINSFALDGCASSTYTGVRLATDDGGFVSRDQGQTWESMGDIGSGGSLRIARSDIGIAMHRPTPTNGAISNSTSRFEIDVTNHGAEAVENIGLYLDFFVYYSSGMTNNSGTSMTISGGSCEPVDELSGRTRDCLIDRLDPGETARLVWVHGIGADAMSLSIEGEIDSERLEDTNINNDRLLYNVNVRSASELSQSSGGGGGSMCWWMLLLILAKKGSNRILNRSKGINYLILGLR